LANLVSLQLATLIVSQQVTLIFWQLAALIFLQLVLTFSQQALPASLQLHHFQQPENSNLLDHFLFFD
jgi:hypothetical protein